MINIDHPQNMALPQNMCEHVLEGSIRKLNYLELFVVLCDTLIRMVQSRKLMKRSEVPLAKLVGPCNLLGFVPCHSGACNGS